MYYMIYVDLYLYKCIISINNKMIQVKCYPWQT